MARMFIGFTTGWWSVSLIRISFFNGLFATEWERYISFLGYILLGYMVAEVIVTLRERE